MRFYDCTKNRLVYLDQQASPDFWDQHWAPDQEIRNRLLSIQDTFVSRETRKYLKPENGPILEGGCGRGQHVAALVKNGYRCIGVDSAPETVSALLEAVPELDIRLGDVRSLDFGAGFFSGYWSLGVIEHFWEGYEAVGQEMNRVLKPGGYLFLAFPVMSPLRRAKARFGLYPSLAAHQEPAGFYQFALDHWRVAADFQSWGFQLIQAKPYDGLKGFKSEIALLHAWLQKLYDYRGSRRPVKALRALLSATLSPWAPHGMLCIFKRRGG